MNQLFLMFFCLVFFLTGCEPALGTVPQMSPVPILETPTEVQVPLQAATSTIVPVTGTYDPNDWIATEILGRPTDTSITVNVIATKSTEVYYEFGIASGTFTAQTVPQTATAEVPLESQIDGLLPNTRYYFRLRYGDVAGPEHTFTTQRTTGSTFTFDIQGDSHPERTKNQFDPALYTRTLQSAATDQPDFYIALGDDFSVDTLKNVNAQTVTALYIQQRQWLGLVGSPVFLVNGNHEQASLANLDGTPDNVAV